MTTTFLPRKKALLAASGAMIAIAAIGTASYAHSTDGNSVLNQKSSAYCEVLATPSGSGLTLQAVFHAQGATHGNYQFSVNSTGGAGRSSINQGGAFSAEGAGLVPLGMVTVAGNSSYAIGLKVSENGVTHDCGGDYAA